jgi:hypothetical protein
MVVRPKNNLEANYGEFALKVGRPITGGSITDSVSADTAYYYYKIGETGGVTIAWDDKTSSTYTADIEVSVYDEAETALSLWQDTSPISISGQDPGTKLWLAVRPNGGNATNGGTFRLRLTPP